MKTHSYAIDLAWQGSTGAGYRSYSRDHSATAAPAPSLRLSADSAFRGNQKFLNPEQLIVIAASSCQLLAFLAAAAQEGIDVTGYQDYALGSMPERGDGMRIDHIELSPTIQVAPGTDHARVLELINDAHKQCYVANSLNARITILPTVVAG
jgi:organic hydroperoxide reductase OsmC/OhrA